MKTAALELAADSIRVNSVHPTAVDTEGLLRPSRPSTPKSIRSKQTEAP